ncbi:SAM-dependent DNA methyltransferase [Verminephrobacter aporrectodeae subsp. tuberculatae]|uniref:HsdM family class I SAM-dependent methyltransferase n=1 Tax=Verminephrobacter aporrectodeae TaxID=1110389 RepID=UPI002244551D|nr:N-6 DNA methylase [Verminephrobacter aporrectodeae]MCW8164023.1 SAM-dependent DNA methyltransferase [Verminephrobacter aporrectodeae subsp. tuberculatae]MCW8168721.1 SAM-dependent DNA methyltransferase [Verminephrobacter aporrectodeae subsp. tuberculatae]
MDSTAFTKTLTATGYLLPDGRPAPGLARAGDDAGARLRAVLSDSRVGLQAEAVFSAQSVPTAIFKDAGDAAPSELQIAQWHEAAWNVGVAPLLWIITPTDVRLYDCYASPAKASPQQIATEPLEVFSLQAEDRLRSLDAMCGRYATETGAFWSSSIGQRIDRRHRVDRELLDEVSALEDKLTHLPPANDRPLSDDKEEAQASRDFAQRLIGRCIFTSYLVDRGIAQPFLPQEFSADVGDMFATVDSAFRLFQWLRSTFNGDLFPMDDPGAEQQRLGDKHLKLLRDFVEGRSLLSGQGRLFRFRFDAIPVDLVSSIYQQFARSSASDDAHTQGLHYTPVELVHLTLDPVFEALPASSRVIDPTCGSGAFLVEAFRRLVWKRTQGKAASRSIVRDVLYTQLYGIDINRSALGIAAFSLYLAALELDEEPVQDIQDLKFHRLIGVTLFEADTVHDELPHPVMERPFDAVVGNPPWTFVKKVSASRKRKAGDIQSSRPRRSPDQEFLWVASSLAGDTGRIGMIMKSSPFFSKDTHAIQSREALLSMLRPVALVNLSALRKEGLFPDATGPALLFLGRCALVGRDDRLLVGSIPWTPDFRRNGVFHIGPGELRSVPLSRVLRTPAMLKATAFGTARDGWLIEKLERKFPTLDQLLHNRELSVGGQGIQVKGGDLNRPPDHYYRLGLVTPKNYVPLRSDVGALERFTHEWLHRPRNAAIFEGPLLLCPKGNQAAALEPGRYSAVVCEKSVLFNESFYGISFAGKEVAGARVLSAILNSSLTAFQLALGGGAWGLERPTVEPNDLLVLRIPDLGEVDNTLLEAVLSAEAAVSAAPNDTELIAALDHAVCDLYGLDRDEEVVASDGVQRARSLLFEGRGERMTLVKRPSSEDLTAYAGEVVRTVNAYLRARGKRHLEAVIYPRHIAVGNAVDGTPGVDAVRFSMVAGAPADAPCVHRGSDAEMNRLSALFRGQVSSEVPPYLNERRQLRIYDDNTLFILKPSEVRYWTRTTGLNDGDAILADHWIKGLHAAVA